MKQYKVDSNFISHILLPFYIQFPCSWEVVLCRLFFNLCWRWFNKTTCEALNIQAFVWKAARYRYLQIFLFEETSKLKVKRPTLRNLDLHFRNLHESAVLIANCRWKTLSFVLLQALISPSSAITFLQNMRVFQDKKCLIYSSFFLLIAVDDNVK